MALDLYAGSISRYLSRAWKTIGQQVAEQAGALYMEVRDPFTDLQYKDKEGQVTAERDAAAWMQETVTRINGYGDLLVPWEESVSADYFTDRPGWEGYSCLALKYALLTVGDSDEPKLAKDAYHFLESPAYTKCTEDKKNGAFQFGAVTTYLPGKRPTMFFGKDVRGDRTAFATLQTLDFILNAICERWGKDRSVVEELGLGQPGADTPFEEAALYGLGVYSRLCRKALEVGLPLLMDR